MNSSPPDNISLNPADKRTDQSLYDFQTGIGAVTHATLDIEHFFSHTRGAHVDTVACLQHYDGGVIAASEVEECLTKVCDILHCAVSIGLVIWLVF